jgi:predicted nucleic acid-binding protein
MKVFLDTNILIDFLSNRPPFTQEASQLFQLSENGKLQLFTSTHVLATTHYVLKKYADESELRLTLLKVSEMVNVVDVTASALKTALKSPHKDFEDAIQIASAEQIQGLDFIITRNLKDFKTSSIPAISILELLGKVD